MSQSKEAELLVWAAGQIRKAQDDGAYGTITIHMKAGEICRLERNDSFIPPTPGTLLKQTGG